MKLKQLTTALLTAVLAAAATSSASGLADSNAIRADISKALTDTQEPQSTQTTTVTTATPAVTYTPTVTTTVPVTTPAAETTVTSTAAKAPTKTETSAETTTTTVTTTVTTTETTTTTTAAPVKPPSGTNLTQVNFSGGALNVKWEPVDCDGCDIYYRVRGTANWNLAAECKAAQEYTAGGFKADTCYEVAVVPFRTDHTGQKISGALASKCAVNHTAINYLTPKAIWIPCFTLQTMIKGRTAAQFSESFRIACQNAKDLGVNTLYVHVRAFSDALYPSDIYPWSRYCTGTVGLSPGYDPLAIMTDTAHRFGLSIHAWINPYRAEGKANLDKTTFGTVKQWYSNPSAYPQYINYASGYGTYWLNPGYPEVRSLIFKGAEEIMSRYAVDGLHIDDYFYPDNNPEFDGAAYPAYSGGRSVFDWRLSNCTATVKGLYDTVKAANPTALFGISPQGNYENNYKYMYADVDLWTANSGYCDYIAPQIYFGYENSKKPFKETLQFWLSLKRSPAVKMYIGIAPANLWLVEEYENKTGIVGDQISDSFACGASGVALYSYESLFTPPDGKQKRASDEINAIRAALR